MAELEQKVAMLEVDELIFNAICSPIIIYLNFIRRLANDTQVECTSLNQELQDMEVRARRGQKKSPDEANQVVQVCYFKVIMLLHCGS